MGEVKHKDEWRWTLARVIYAELSATNLYNSEESLAPHEEAEDVAVIADALKTAHTAGKTEQRKADLINVMNARRAAHKLELEAAGESDYAQALIGYGMHAACRELETDLSKAISEAPL